MNRDHSVISEITPKHYILDSFVGYEGNFISSKGFLPTVVDGTLIWIKFAHEDLQDLLEITSKKDVLFIIGDWNAKVGNHEIPWVTGKFGLGVQNEARQKLTEFCQENTLVTANTLFQQHKRWLYTWTSPGIRLIIFFTAKDGVALYSQQKQDLELTVARIIRSLLQNSGLNWRK